MSATPCIAINSIADPLLLDVSRLAPGAMRKYCLTTSHSHTVRFIVWRGSDGKIRVVMDACQACYANNMGYRIRDREFVCRFCGKRYSTDGKFVGEASCMPFRVPFKVRGGVVEIAMGQLKAGERLFSARPFYADTLFTFFNWIARRGEGRALIDVLSDDHNLPFCHKD